jgi:hypothetical protein
MPGNGSPPKPPEADRQQRTAYGPRTGRFTRPGLRGTPHPEAPGAQVNQVADTNCCPYKRSHIGSSM